MSALSELAAKHNLAVVAISHLNKAAGRDLLMRVSGSLAFVTAARAAFLIAQDPNDDNRRMLLPMKNNIGNDKTGFAYSIEGCTLNNGINTSRVLWETQTIDIKAHEAMSSSTVDWEETNLLKEAIDFLKDELAYSSKTVNKLKKAANEYGLSWGTVIRAKVALNIIPKKSGLTGGWVWTLPTKIKNPAENLENEVIPFAESVHSLPKECKYSEEAQIPL